ncbi:MAG: hypothetical protein WAX89_05470 [Alphaproteobacteria bacterium]
MILYAVGYKNKGQLWVEYKNSEEKAKARVDELTKMNIAAAAIEFTDEMTEAELDAALADGIEVSALLLGQPAEGIERLDIGHLGSADNKQFAVIFSNENDEDVIEIFPTREEAEARMNNLMDMGTHSLMTGLAEGETAPNPDILAILRELRDGIDGIEAQEDLGEYDEGSTVDDKGPTVH